MLFGFSKGYSNIPMVPIFNIICFSAIFCQEPTENKISTALEKLAITHDLEKNGE